MLSDFKLYCKATVIKTEFFGKKSDTYIMEQNRELSNKSTHLSSSKL